MPSPSNKLDLTNKRFGRWTAKERLPGSYWLCVCDCGTARPVFIGNLRNGTSLSCGCLRDEKNSRDNRTHGLTKTAEYKVWAGIKRRCTNPHDKAFLAYGAKGITMCQRWSDSFEAFLADMGKRPSPGHSIDRIDNSKGYEPGNCRWATKLEQMHNRTDTRLITFNGASRVSAEWARITGIQRTTIEFRLAHGWTVERALTTPVVHGRNQFSKP